MADLPAKPKKMIHQALFHFSQWRLDIVRNPWFLFISGLITHSTLAYIHVPLWVKVWIGLTFLIITAIALWRPNTYPSHVFQNQQKWIAQPHWMFLLALFGLAAFLRLYRFVDLSVWPMWDDGHYGLFAFNLAEKWRWQYFFGSEQYTPVYTWLQGLFFKCVEPSLSSLLLYPILYSIALLPLAYFALRKIFSSSLSF